MKSDFLHISGGDDKHSEKGYRADSGSDVPNNCSEDITRLYESYFRAIYSYCTYRLFTAGYAEDATSEVFLKLVERYPDFRNKTELEIKNWLYGTASNVVAAYLRDSRRRQKIAADLQTEAVRVQNDDESTMNWPVLYKAISRLKQRDQDIVIMRYFQGLELAAVAEIVGVRYGTVRTRLSRAIRKLRQELGENLE